MRLIVPKCRNYHSRSLKPCQISRFYRVFISITTPFGRMNQVGL